MKLTKYGNYLSVNRFGIWVIVDGYWLSIYRNVNTGKWAYEITENFWRRTKTPVPVTIEIKVEK